jgi:hypothetical protein
MDQVSVRGQGERAVRGNWSLTRISGEGTRVLDGEQVN